MVVYVGGLSVLEILAGPGTAVLWEAGTQTRWRLCASALSGGAVTGMTAVLAAGKGPSHRLILAGLNAEVEGGAGGSLYSHHRNRILQRRNRNRGLTW